MTTKEFQILERLIGEDQGPQKTYSLDYTHSKKLLEFKGDQIVLISFSTKIAETYVYGDELAKTTWGKPLVEITNTHVNYNPTLLQNYLKEQLKSVICNRTFKHSQSGDSYEFKCQEVDIDFFINNSHRDRIQVNYHWGLFLTNSSESTK